MIFSAILFAVAVQREVVGTGQAAPKFDASRRQVVLPGKEDSRIPPVEQLECKSFLGYSEMQTFLNLLQGDSACSGEILADENINFRQVNFLKMSEGVLPVIIYSPVARISKASKIVVFLSGGPRTLTISRPLVKLLAARGFVVIIPIYRGSLETEHPAADLPVAVNQIKALYHWAGNRLRATVGVSAGGYLAAASCRKSCAARYLLAPPLTTPEESLSAKKINWNQNHSITCLWQAGENKKVCETDEAFFKSFWGSYNKTSLSKLLNGNCSNTTIIVSAADQRVYDKNGIRKLRSIGCNIETPMNIDHAQIDADPRLNEQVVAAIEGLDKDSP